METHYKKIKSISFNSEIKNVSKAELVVDQVCGNNRLNEDHYGNVLIAVTEAVNNAIQHGNKGDVNKEVTLSVDANEEEIRFLVKDGGKGFSFNNLPDPTAPENIEKETGRGIFLMRSLADEVIFEEGGSKVILVFYSLK